MKKYVLLLLLSLFNYLAFSQIKFVSKSEFEAKSDYSNINLEGELATLGKESQRLSKYLSLETKKKHRQLKDNFSSQEFSKRANVGLKISIDENGKVGETTIMVSEYKIDSTNLKSSISEVDYLNLRQKEVLIKLVADALRDYVPKIDLNHKFILRVSINLFSALYQDTNDVKQILAQKSKSDTILVLSRLGLTSMPNDIYEFKNLKTLNLSNNYIEKINLNIKKLPNLESLILNDNILTVNAIKIKRNTNLKAINLSNNGLIFIPNRMHKNKGLEEITLANNLISEFGKIRFRRFKNLKFLNLYQNNLQNVPSKIGYFKNLEMLDLYYNNLRSLPIEIGNLKNLHTLAVSNNKLWALPNTLIELKSLKILYLHHNKVTILPTLPPNIEVLDFGYNLVESLPSNLEQLDKLKELDFSNNNIKGSFVDLLKLDGLQTVYISKNLDNEKNAEEIKQLIVDLEKKSVKVK